MDLETRILDILTQLGEPRYNSVVDAERALLPFEAGRTTYYAALNEALVQTYPETMRFAVGSGNRGVRITGRIIRRER